MFKWVALAAALGYGWWHFIGNTSLTDKDVYDYYLDLKIATQGQEAEKLCDMLHEEYHGKSMVSAGGQVSAEESNKESACEGYTKLFGNLEHLRQGMDVSVAVGFRYHIHSIELSEDKRSAVVDVSQSLLLGPTQVNARGKETLVRHRGKVVSLSSESRTSMAAR